MFNTILFICTLLDLTLIKHDILQYMTINKCSNTHRILRDHIDIAKKNLLWKQSALLCLGNVCLYSGRSELISIVFSW
jgi:hypothetical protein